ncbi:hypothetical protein KR100_11965 [Synechococcus sp. KORDI-100]|uniref:hypothetical protein n=1 Tax=Synechococcus sp. KORDI-100 TaxID=1280380 RepID=UPI0004E07E73|nr:hypothetical protein [Synechococcus sp. KORDI-100]AII44065.1 hypothetical protein KR100_11965 [Synechococcus sp. KORDI-100]
MAKDHDHDHHGHDHDHDHDHGEEVLEFSAKKPSKLKSFDSDALIHVDGIEDGSFAVASSKKELKALMKSDADVVYDEKKGKLYLNDNGTAKGWGKKKVGGLLATFKGKPDLTADHFEGLSAHKGDAITGGGGSNGGDIKEQIASLREGLSESEVSELYGETLIDPKKGLKSITKAGKKEGYKFDKAELGAALDEMDDSGAFSDVELDAAALASLMGMGGEQERSGSSGGS